MKERKDDKRLSDAYSDIVEEGLGRQLAVGATNWGRQAKGAVGSLGRGLKRMGHAATGDIESQQALNTKGDIAATERSNAKKDQWKRGASENLIGDMMTLFPDIDDAAFGMELDNLFDKFLPRGDTSTPEVGPVNSDPESEVKVETDKIPVDELENAWNPKYAEHPSEKGTYWSKRLENGKERWYKWKKGWEGWKPGLLPAE